VEAGTPKRYRSPALLTSQPTLSGDQLHGQPHTLGGRGGCNIVDDEAGDFQPGDRISLAPNLGELGLDDSFGEVCDHAVAIEIDLGDPGIQIVADLGFASHGQGGGHDHRFDRQGQSKFDLAAGGGDQGEFGFFHFHAFFAGEGRDDGV